MKALATAMFVLFSAGIAHADVIDTFRGTCLTGIGNADGIRTLGAKMGFDMTKLSAGSYMGNKSSTDESLQINAFTSHKFECAVTTSDVADPKALEARFFQAIGLKPSGSKASGRVNGTTYTFAYNTHGGEALVVYAD